MTGTCVYDSHCRWYVRAKLTAVDNYAHSSSGSLSHKQATTGAARTRERNFACD